MNGFGSARKVWVSGNDVYVLGENANAVSYNRLIWKNGVLLAPYDGTFSAKNLISDMFIADK